MGPIVLFGRPTQIVVDDSLAGRVIRRELAMYPATTEAAELTFRATHEPPPIGAAVNPALHTHLDDGFVARYPNAAVRFRFDGDRLVEATVHLPPALRGARAWRSRWRSIQYANVEETSGQILHELAFVPSVYFDRDRLPLHASAFSLPGTGGVLIGGTGGVGKTTLALDLCLRFGASFAADDIAVIDGRGRVHPNLAYPKIYGYNVQGDDALLDRVVATAPVGERLHWKWRLGRLGAAHVRRRISPRRLYGSVVEAPEPIRRCITLVRERRSRIGVEEVSAHRAAAMGAAVLQAEYDQWHRQLSWHAFNALALGRDPHLLVGEWFELFRERAAHALGAAACSVVRVPIGLDHAAFRRELTAIVRDG